MEFEMSLPPGFRFHPTDEELVMHYLLKKCASHHIAVPIIAEIDLYKYNPWELPDLASYGEKEWYFFSLREKKYPNGTRPNRVAASGYWKATGADKPICKPKAMGIKKALVFYTGKAPKGEKTDWIMHEYRLADVDRSACNHKNNSKLDDWVLCRIYNKKGTIEIGTTTSKLSPIQEEEEEKKPDVMMSSSKKEEEEEEEKKPDVMMPSIHEQEEEEEEEEEEDVFNGEPDPRESIQKLHTDSSSSNNAVSPEFAYEVQCQPKLFGDEFVKNEPYFPYNYMDSATTNPPAQGGGTSNDDLFMNDEFEVSPLQDMFMGMLPY